MKKTLLKTAFLVMMFFIIASSCTKDGGTVLDTFIPNFKNGYKDLDHTDVLFFFSSTGSDAEGTFSGTENDNNLVETFHFTGTYKNSYLELTYSDGPRVNKKFTGNFNTTTTNPYRLTVKNGNDVIRLEAL